MKIYWTATGEVHALKGIDAAFPGGAITAVVGPSGSGKSSLLRILGGMDPPTAGSVRIGEIDLSGMGRRRLRRVRRALVGYVFQRPSDNLISYLSARDHVRLAGRLRGGGRSHEVDQILESLGLAERRNMLPRHLSGGEQQRLAFAQAIVGRPALVVADEPTAELDSETASALIRAIRGLARDGSTFVVSTHDPDVVRRADQVLALRHGALEAETREARRLSVIDEAGRIQLPPEALKLFPGRRAEIAVADGHVRITPP